MQKSQGSLPIDQGNMTELNLLSGVFHFSVVGHLRLTKDCNNIIIMNNRIECMYMYEIKSHSPSS